MSDYVPLIDEEVAVHVPGLSRPLYGVVKVLEAERVTVAVVSARGSATMQCPMSWVRKWRVKR